MLLPSLCLSEGRMQVSKEKTFVNFLDFQGKWKVTLEEICRPFFSLEIHKNLYLHNSPSASSSLDKSLNFNPLLYLWEAFIPCERTYTHTTGIWKKEEEIEFSKLYILNVYILYVLFRCLYLVVQVIEFRISGC